ncbi:hypothetical protein F4780DRAFT_531020 [Xylariomycetidae sp. FL0641]|nr:hypothetical protein F4780DRAFT_531020 [Xylariomycetidae sp. FL0641]
MRWETLAIDFAPLHLVAGLGNVEAVPGEGGLGSGRLPWPAPPAGPHPGPALAADPNFYFSPDQHANGMNRIPGTPAASGSSNLTTSSQDVVICCSDDYDRPTDCQHDEVIE